VRAGRGRPTVLSQDGSSIVIRGGTELTLPSTGTETVVQRIGSARYQIEPGSVADFLVETPYLVIGIKGTVFEVLVNEAGTKVGVSEGRVEVTTPDGRFRAELAPGQTARVRAAAGSAPEVQSESGGADAPASQDPAGSAPPDQAAGSDVRSPQDPTESASPDQAASSDATSPSTQTAVGGTLGLVTSVTRSLWSGIGGLLSDVDIVYDDRLSPVRRGTLVRTLSGGIASVGGDSGGGSGSDAAGGSSSSGTAVAVGAAARAAVGAAAPAAVGAAAPVRVAVASVGWPRWWWPRRRRGQRRQRPRQCCRWPRSRPWWCSGRRRQVRRRQVRQRQVRQRQVGSGKSGGKNGKR
jgi:FecR protein